MKDWTMLAKASGLNIPDGDLERAGVPLAEIEKTLRPLADGLAPEEEPSYEFDAGREGE